MTEPKIVMLEDDLIIQELMKDTVGERYKHCVITADPMYILANEFDCGVFDYDLGLPHVTGQIVAEKVREMYGNKKFLISNTSQLLSKLESTVYDSCVQKATGINVLYSALDEFDKWYKKNNRG